MNVTREVILDLLPVYLSGEASPDTRTLIEEYLKQDEDLAKKIHSEWMEKLAAVAPSTLPPELEMRAFRRTKSLLARQRWLMGLAIFFTSLALSFQFEITDGHLRQFQFLLQRAPVPWAVCLGLGAAFWIGYLLLRRRIKAPAF